MNRAGSLLPTADAIEFRPGLFVVWHAARSHRERILRDLQDRFEVLGIYEIEWSTSRVMRNFERFYSDLDVRGVYHLFNKGDGPLTAAIVRDPRPRKSPRWTSRGERTVNVNFVEAKAQYREWTQGLEVHCSETPAEAQRDVMMLIGADMNTCQAVARLPGNHPVERIKRDISGCAGWSSANELFSALNECGRYAVLFERDRNRSELFDSNDRPLEILTEDLPSTHRILNLSPVPGAQPHGGCFHVQVAGRQRKLALRYPGDGFFDERWGRRMLERRVFDHSGFYRLANDDCFDSLALHVLAHRPVATSLARELSIAAHRLGRDDWNESLLTNPALAAEWLNAMLQRRGYAASKPLDASVAYRVPGQAGAGNRHLPRFTLPLRSIGATMHAGLLQLRDRLLLQFPWLRQLKRRKPGQRHRAAAR